MRAATSIGRRYVSGIDLMDTWRMFAPVPAMRSSLDDGTAAQVNDRAGHGASLVGRHERGGIGEFLECGQASEVRRAFDTSEILGGGDARRPGEFFKIFTNCSGLWHRVWHKADHPDPLRCE